MNQKLYPKLGRIFTVYNEGHIEFHNLDEANDVLVIDSNDLTFDASRIVPAKVLEYDLNLLWLGTKYDEWFRRFLGTGKSCLCTQIVYQISFFFTSDEKLKLVYHYPDTPLRGPSEKYIEAYPENFKRTDIPTLNYHTPYTLTTWSSLNDLKNKIGDNADPRRQRCNIHINTIEDVPYQEDSWYDIR